MSTLRWPILQHKQGIQLCYGAYYDTKQHFVIQISLGFRKMSPSNLFPIKFWKFLAISFGWSYYDSKLLKMAQKYYKSPLL